jgi:hypothetical protein
MSEHTDNHTVRRVLLPSGRTIEVVRFGDGEVSDRSGRLHMCPTCRSDLVQPIAWCESAPSRWELTLECPNCGWSELGVFEREQVEALEEELDRGLADMLEDLRRLTHVNMNDEINRFVVALQSDLILPEDF